MKAPSRQFLSLITLLGLIVSACSSTSSPIAPDSSLPTVTPSPVATQPFVRTMRIDIGGYRLYLRCMGIGSPTVLFDAGLADDVSVWDHVQPTIAQFTQACAYDRANIGQSDNRPASIKVSAQEIALELHAVLSNAHIPGPYVLVGHSLGGLFTQMFACLYPDEVGGVVLVDSTHPEQATRLAAALGPQYAQSARQSFPAEGMTYDDVLAMQAQVDAVKGRFPQVPLVVLVRSRYIAGPAWTAAQMEQVWTSLQRDLSKRSAQGKLVVAQNSGHYIQLDRPDLVIGAIREIVMEVQQS